MRITPEVKAAAIAALEQFFAALEDTPKTRRSTARAPARPDVQPTQEEIEQAERALRRKAGV